MKGMRKWWLAAGMGALTLSMAACADREGDGQTAEQTAEQTTLWEESAQGGTSAETPEETSGVSGTIEYEGSGNAREGEAVWSDEMAAIRQAAADVLGENYWPDDPIAPETLEDVYGIPEDMYDDYMGESSGVSTNVDTLLIVRAKDDKVKEVEKALEAYRDAQIDDALQHPANAGKVQASRIQTYGNYVCFVQLGADIGNADEISEEAVIEQCLEQNELALEVIGRNVPQ